MLLLFWRPTHYYLGGRPDRVELLPGLVDESLQQRAFTAVVSDHLELLADDYDVHVDRRPRPPVPPVPPEWTFPPRPAPGLDWVPRVPAFVPQTTLRMQPVPVAQTAPPPTRKMESPRTLAAVPVEENRRANRRRVED